MRLAKGDESAMNAEPSDMDNLVTSITEIEWLQGLRLVARHHSQCFFVVEAGSVVEAQWVALPQPRSKRLPTWPKPGQLNTGTQKAHFRKE